MKYALDVQTAASLLVVGTFLASEGAAWHLEAHPASVLAWQLNLGVFRVFEHARTGLRAAHVLFSPASLPAASGLLLAVIAAHRLRCRFAVALFANLSFMGVLALSYAAIGDVPGHGAALTLAALAGDAQVPLVPGLVVISFIGFATSHWSFLRAIAAAGPSPGPVERPGGLPRRQGDGARPRFGFRGLSARWA